MNNVTQMVPYERRMEEWTDRIGSALRKSVDAIVEVGQLLAEAKADLPHGSWEQMLKSPELPFGVRTARRFMAIAQNQILSKRSHGSVLPPSYRTLADLASWKDEELECALANHAIRPDTQRNVSTSLRHPVVEFTVDPPWSMAC